MVLVAIGISVALFSLWVISGYLPTMNIQTPVYEVMGKKPDYEIRLYEPYVIAETARKGNRQESLSSGFSELFQFISGNNVGRAKIRMTAPVLQSGESEAQKILMSAPVLKYGDGGSSMIAFVMPPGSRLDELPQPKNPAVHLRVVPAHKVAVISFSGYATDAAIKENIAKLLTALKRDSMFVRAAPQIALYNPPWTPPFMRRNEILIELD
jgi:hypothetical protein